MSEPPVPPPPSPSACWSCSRVIEPRDRYCRFCGQGQGEHVSWYYQRWGIVLATVFGLGPFGIILVIRSPRLSLVERWVWALAMGAVSAWLLWRLYAAFQLLSAFFGPAMRF